MIGHPTTKVIRGFV